MPLLTVRYALPLAIFILGVVVLVIRGDGEGVGFFAAATGAALSVLLLNILFRAGVKGDRERDEEEAARDYFDKHGRWPDDDRPARRG